MKDKSKTLPSMNKMNNLERSLLFLIIGLYLTQLIRIGSVAENWTNVQFLFTYLTCILIFAQFIIRYLGIVYRYKTEKSLGSWIVSILIVATSLVCIQLAPVLPYWFLSFGFLLLLATFKTLQSKRTISRIENANNERMLRLEEFMVFESAFGILMILCFFIARSSFINSVQLTHESMILCGSFIAFYYSLVSTTINVVRVIRNKYLIEKHLQEQE